MEPLMTAEGERCWLAAIAALRAEGTDPATPLPRLMEIFKALAFSAEAAVTADQALTELERVTSKGPA
jgi:hypothetical protein